MSEQKEGHVYTVTIPALSFLQFQWPCNWLLRTVHLEAMQLRSNARVLQFTRYSSDIFHVWRPVGSCIIGYILNFFGLFEPKIIEIGTFLNELFKKIDRRFETRCIL